MGTDIFPHTELVHAIALVVVGQAFYLDGFGTGPEWHAFIKWLGKINYAAGAESFGQRFGRAWLAAQHEG